MNPEPIATRETAEQVRECLLNSSHKHKDTKFDYIIVGSGAGGGPLACRLALAGKTVLLIEAGGDPGKEEVHQVPGYHGAATEEAGMSWSNSVRHYGDDQQQAKDHKYQPDRDPSQPAYNKPNHDPSLQPCNPPLSGASEAQRGLGKGGIFYPRSSGIGGCTGHHAMIVIRPNDRDWDHIAQETGDPSWRGEAMRPYFARFERCLYRAQYHGFLGKLFGGLGRVVQRALAWMNPQAALDEGGHGRKGWQPTSFIAPEVIKSILKKDSRFAKVLIGTLLSVSDRVRKRMDDDSTIVGWLRDLVAFVKRVAIRFGVVNAFDPNDLKRRNGKTWEGAYLIPTGIECERAPTDPSAFDENGEPLFGKRAGVREFILRTQKQCSDPECKGKLIVQSETFVTKLILTPGHRGAAHRAIGVECELGRNLYQAGPLHGNAEPAGNTQFFTRGEVILCGGSYNTPQLLMLSGIGDAEELKKHGIEVRVELPGVGRNLQDRYEVSVVSEMRDEFTSLDGVSFTPGDPRDPARLEWLDKGTGLYATNGASLAIIRRSDYADKDNPEPDLFTFGAPAAFRGYYWDYSKQLFRSTKDAPNERRNLWTWCILKAYTRNNGGTVRLRSNDWRVPPDICLNSFAASGCEDWRKDVQALAQAVEEVRTINGRINAKHPDLFSEEIQPGHTRPDSREETSALGEWIQNEAWGHHACGTCRIGKDAWRANPRDLVAKLAVIDGKFRVHGVEGLRIVDASVFPKIPGYFILAPIFMISEKAADTLLHPESDRKYPKAIQEIEAAAIRQRRSKAHADTLADPKAPDKASQPPEELAAIAAEKAIEKAAKADDASLPPRTVGLALSGGGIRSATFALGVLQAMAEKNRLRAVDFLSTVSGGGYTGSFLGRMFTQPTAAQADDPAGRVQKEIAASHSPALRWLRRHANYLVSSGSDDAWQMLGIFYRNLFAVHLVIGLFLFTVFGLLAGVSQGTVFTTLLDKLPALPEFSTLRWSAWWWLPAGVIGLALLPCTLGYWLGRKAGSQRPYPPHALGAWLVFVAGSAIALSVPGGYLYGLAGLVLLGLAWLWQEFAHLAPDGNPRHEETTGNRVRNRMTRLLEETLKILALTAFWVALDTLAVNVAGRGWTATMAQIAAGLTPLLAFMRNSVLQNLLPGTGGSGLGPWLKKTAGVLLVIFLLLIVDVFAHELAALPDPRWLWGTVAVCAAFSLVLGHAFDLLNLTSLNSPYAARILRTFQGATNEARIYAGNSSPYKNVQVVHPDDDIPHHRYRPERNGGPLHLINVCVNQTVDHHSMRDVPDRRGMAMAVGSFGVSVANYFAAWVPPQGLPRWRRFALWLEGFRRDTSDSLALEALRWTDDPDTFHPLGRRDGDPTVPEKLTLGTWTAISGAAFSTGIGQRTSVLVSTLRGLLNLRLGYWWNSGTQEGERPGLFPDNLWRRIKDLPGFLFRAQSLLLSEWRGRFRGPSKQLWNLSDGGHQEVTGLYELIRRRVKFMIVTDAGEDPNYQFADFGDLERQALEDFQATITWIVPTQPEWTEVPPWIKEWFDGQAIGLPHEIKRTGTHSAAFARVTYAAEPGNRSWILLMKPCLGKDQSSLALLDYAKAHEDFPQQSTNDQFFDDVQWESYRHLGHFIGSQVLSKSRAP